MKKYTVLLLAILFAGCLQVAFGQQEISVASLLKEMTDAASVARIASPSYTEKQASSYDRKSIANNEPGWFANGDFNQYIRTEKVNGHDEYVMMDADGPGAIVRFWLTTQKKEGRIRFYLDNAATPVIDIPAYDLMKGPFNVDSALLIPHSSYQPNGVGGNTLYYPIPYQKHCKITVEFPDSNIAKTSHYYQINYRTYAPGTKVITFRKDDINKSAVAGTGTLLLETGVYALYSAPQNLTKQASLGKGEAISFNLPTGENIVRLLNIKLTPQNSSDIAKALRAVILKISFDGEETVYCPLGDFAGSGYGGKPIKSWYRDMDEFGNITTRWGMPYQKTATVTIINKAVFTVKVEAEVATNTWKWGNNSMYFHTTYKYEENIKDAKWDYDVNKVAAQDTAAPIEWNFITIKGRGIYLGNTLSVNNHMDAWYGEGDAKVWVDDDTFPSEFGTGLEDYYNTSWAPVVVYQTPFANAPYAQNENSFGYNTFTRTRNLDGVPFTKYFRYDLEMLSWKGGTIDAAATVYWYGAPGAKLVSKP